MWTRCLAILTRLYILLDTLQPSGDRCLTVLLQPIMTPGGTISSDLRSGNDPSVPPLKRQEACLGYQPCVLISAGLSKATNRLTSVPELQGRGMTASGAQT